MQSPAWSKPLTVWPELIGVAAQLPPVPCCSMVTVCPATLSVPVRGPLPVLAATWNCAVPLPVTLLGGVTVIQLVLLTAIQAQLLVVVTLILPVPPLAGKGKRVAESA